MFKDYYYTVDWSKFFVEPEGYKLVEKDDHKKKRLVDEAAYSTDQIEYWEELIIKTRKRLKEVKEELKGLD